MPKLVSSPRQQNFLYFLYDKQLLQFSNATFQLSHRMERRLSNISFFPV